MKGFPNQIADLAKLANGMRVLSQIVDARRDAKSHDVFGEALVREGVAGTGHVPLPVDEYLRRQRRKKTADQSHRTAARGLRELFRLLGLIDDSGAAIVITADGRTAAGFAGAPLEGDHLDFWRRVIMEMQYTDEAGTSHPYQVLLRLVSRRPGITRAKCALALEAADDSPAELDRIVGLADLDEPLIRRQIGVSQSNWDNAKKILPRFAEQLGDVVKTGQTYVLADSPGRAATPARLADDAANVRGGVRAPRASRQVSPDQIGNAGLAERDEPVLPPNLDPARHAQAIAERADRLRRHNRLVREFATRLHRHGAMLFEDPFDILALLEDRGLLVEVKTLSGTEADERDRVKDALSQLLYYEAFVTSPIAGNVRIVKIACFERQLRKEHQDWFNALGIATAWQNGSEFSGDAMARRLLQGIINLI